MSSAKRFEDLVAWQKARLLANDVYRITREGPLARDFGLRDQMQRAAVSIVSNIAEGFERDTIPDFIHFLFIAKGSAGELRTQLYLALDQQLVGKEVAERLIDEARHASIVISHLIGYLKTRINAPKR